MWSVGAKWNIGKEEFIKDIDWINYLNLRATYGINGNAEKSTSPLTLVSVGSSVNSTTGTITGNISLALVIHLCVGRKLILQI